jgi:hypothetical protein
MGNGPRRWGGRRVKAYAVQFDGVHFLVYAETAAKAKGLVIDQANNVNRGWAQSRFKSLGCRRWFEMDSWGPARVERWGTPGERDWETGTYIALPDPWKVQEARP